VTVLLGGERRWSCPNCSHRDLTFAGEVNRFHRCPGLRGLLAPLVLDGTDCTVRAVERGDYVAGERVRTDAAGRPVMAVEVERDDGTDVVVFAPTASVRRS
jgi:hypothetical protein